MLCIVGFEIKRCGVCDLPIEKIAALAGVCRTMVQNTIHEARRLGHITIVERPQRGSKSLTNLVRICSPEWRAWLARGPSAARLIGSKLVKTASTTKIIDLRKEGIRNERCHERGQAPPEKSTRGAPMSLRVSPGPDERSNVPNDAGPP